MGLNHFFYHLQAQAFKIHKLGLDNICSSPWVFYLTTHLDLYIQFYVQQFYTIDNFTFETTISQWKSKKVQYCVEFLSKWHVGEFWILKVISFFFV